MLKKSASSSHEFLYGVAPVLAAMSQRARLIDRLLLQESLVLSKRKDIAAIERMAREQNLPVVAVPKQELNLCCANRPHQGVVLQTQPLGFTPLAAPPAVVAGSPAPVWLALDEVSDPQNLGALLRSAYFLGASGVVVSEKNSSPLTPAVSKASAGAMELMQVRSTRSIVRLLGSAREQGWLVLGAALEEAVLPSEAAAATAARPTMLVLGSEGHGLRASVRRASDAS